MFLSLFVVVMNNKGGALTNSYPTNKTKLNSFIAQRMESVTLSPFLSLTSGQARLPAELKHINKRRRRN